MVALVITTPYVCDDHRVQPRLARPAEAAAAVVAAIALSGCGRPARPAHLAARAADREWVANATGVIDQLQTDVATATPAGSGLAGARRSLHDLSDLYGLLVAYTDFGGCTRMIGGIGTAPPRYALVVTRLERACRGFEDAAVLFTRAASGDDAHALLAASREVKAAASLLYRANLVFVAARSASS
jgi:hypothetical protein